jgi:hypothetical protein
MSGYGVQLHGNIKFGAGPGDVTDYSADISQLTINAIKATVQTPGSYANPVTAQKPTTASYTVTCTFAGNTGDATGVWAELWDAFHNAADGRLYFEGSYHEGPVGATNPKFTGYLLPSDLSAGDAVGALKQQSKTWPAEDIVGPLYTES